jgi:hypothetical protein
VIHRGGMLAGIAGSASQRRAGDATSMHAVEPLGKRLGDALAADARIIDRLRATWLSTPGVPPCRPQALGPLPWKITWRGGSK